MTLRTLPRAPHPLSRPALPGPSMHCPQGPRLALSLHCPAGQAWTGSLRVSEETGPRPRPAQTWSLSAPETLLPASLSLCCHRGLSATSVSRPPQLAFCPIPLPSGPAIALPTTTRDSRRRPPPPALCQRPVLPLSRGKRALGLAQGAPPLPVRNECACGPQMWPRTRAWAACVSCTYPCPLGRDGGLGDF